MVSYFRPTLSFLSTHHKHAASFSKLPPDYSMDLLGLKFKTKFSKSVANYTMDLLGLVFQTNFNQLGKMAMFKLKKFKSLFLLYHKPKLDNL